MKDIQRQIAALWEEPKPIVIYGNFALVKKNFNIPHHLSNTMEATDLIAYVMEHGGVFNLGQIAGFTVTQWSLGMERVLLAQSQTKVHIIIGL